MNIPAAGLGSRPPSLVSTVSSSVDEGGFNEPSPDICAKLKPAYPFDPPICDEPFTKPEPGEYDFEENKLTYVDVGYRLNPEGNESKQIFGETELYQTSIKNSVLEELEKEELRREPYTPRTITKPESCIYASIKPEIPPPTELMLESSFDDFDSEKGYHSPQTILDPTRPTLIGDGEAAPIQQPPTIITKPIPPELPSRPPLPEGPPLDLQDVEYADASDEEPEVEEKLIPDTMTADEAERLLSSR